VKVFNRANCCQDRIKGLSVFIKEGERYVTTCGNITEVHASYLFKCTGIGDIIEISTHDKTGPQNLAEIQVFGTQDAEKVLTILNADMSNFRSNFPPSNLIDGNIHNFATTTEGADLSNGMWFRVHLAVGSHITAVKVFNRANCCQDRIKGLSVFIKEGERYVTTCGNITEVHASYLFKCTGIGDIIEISTHDKTGQQNLAEIQVFGTQVPEGSAEIEIKNRLKYAVTQKAGVGTPLICDLKLTNVKLDNPNDPNNVDWYKVNAGTERDTKLVEGDGLEFYKRKGTYRLWFDNPQPEDSGIYKCEFKKKGVTASTDVSIMWE